MVVVSRFDPDPPRALVLCAPITTQYRESQYEVSIGKPKFLREKSYVNLQGIAVIQFRELESKVGRLEVSVFTRIAGHARMKSNYIKVWIGEHLASRRKQRRQRANKST